MADLLVNVLDSLAAGQSQDEILAAYPYWESDDIAGCLRYAVRCLDHRSSNSGGVSADFQFSLSSMGRCPASGPTQWLRDLGESRALTDQFEEWLGADLKRGTH